MMGNYAVVNTGTGVVENIVDWNGDSEWAPPEGYTAVESLIAGIGWTYIDGDFFAPPVIPRDPAEITSSNAYLRDTLLAQAALAIAPLQDAVDLEIAIAPEVNALNLWKKYRVALIRVDLALTSPVWPVAPA